MEEKNNLLHEEAIIEDRKKKVLNFFKTNPSAIFTIILILLVVLGVYTRYLPLTNHGGNPGLWDSTINDYTLGPDLDPFLFLRYAKTIIENGSLPEIDTMRNVPLGFGTKIELPMISYAIVFTYNLVNLFGNYSVNFAGAFMPVWIFAFTILAFFFFVREIFRRKDEKSTQLKANFIATISTLFMIILPGFLSRTVAGIPEKESLGFFFMFLAFFLYLRSWKSEKIRLSIIWAALAGIATALMGLSWGGVLYIYITISLATLIAFLLNKIGLKESIAYIVWLVLPVIITMSLTTHYSISGFVSSLDTGLATFVFALLIVNIILIKTNLRKNLSEKFNLPETIVSLLVSMGLGIILVLIFFGPSFFMDKLNALNQVLFNPVIGRWNTTVAENKQPYFVDWIGNFGSVIFWLFVVGSGLLFYKTFNKLRKNDALILTGLYILFLFGLMFSRYSASSILNGDNFISKFIYYGSALLLIGSVLYLYHRYHKEKNEAFEKIEFEYLFLFALFVLTVFTARGAVRLIMVLIPIAPIFLSYLMAELFFGAWNSENKDKKIILAIAFAIVLLLAAYFGFQYFNQIKSQSYNSVPYYYTNQWQNAMSWVRDNTPTNAVFAHWWDYGYWVQSLGNRATVTDGGNAITWWNYFTGRLVLTGEDQQDALGFLYNHNATYLLIDSTDIGKYGAYSQIGSDENFDRLSSGPITLFSDQKEIQETKDHLIRTYSIPSGEGKVMIVGMEEDLIIYENATKITLYRETSGFLGINLKYSSDDTTMSFLQPEAIYYLNGRQKNIPMRYLYYNNRLIDFKSGIESAVYIIPKVSSNSIDYMGAALYISPRVMKTLFAQLYLLNNSLGNFDNFKLVHSENDVFTNQLLGQGYHLEDFNYFYNIGLQGPIKIWQVEYTGQEKVNESYLETSQPASITWKF